VTYDLVEPTLWFIPGVIVRYRTLSALARYEPDEPFPSGTGRFSNGLRYVLYLADSAEGAVAEWLRVYPEFLHLQDALRIRVSEVTIDGSSPALDVRDSTQAAKVPFPFARLRSSEHDPLVRFHECHDLADDADAALAAGIAYPSAAYDVPNACNIVLFAEPPSRWRSLGVSDVTRPRVDPVSVRRLL
jgi:hypothetical protein